MFDRELVKEILRQTLTAANFPQIVFYLPEKMIQ